MKIAILTADEPLYLPAFFDRFLAHRASDVVGVFACEPVYKHQTKLTMLRRYVRSFGWWNAVRLAWKVLGAKIADRLRIGYSKRRFASVASAAAYYGIPFFQPRDVNTKEFRNQLTAMGTELILSVSCPQIFKDKLISLPPKGCLNLHGADLPAYRGIMPSFWMLANGETQAGVTLFFVNAGIDTGDVAGKRIFPILPKDTLDTFVRRAKREACDLALDVLAKIDAGTVTRTPLEGEGTYFGWPTRQAYRQFHQRGRRLW